MWAVFAIDNMTTVTMKLNSQGMQILMEELHQNEVWAIYLMGQGKEMTDAISKAALTRIICVLCKKLNWTEEQKDCANNPKTRLNNKEDQIIIQKGPIEKQDKTKSQMDSKITDLSRISELMDTDRTEMQSNKEDNDIPANFENIVCDRVCTTGYLRLPCPLPIASNNKTLQGKAVAAKIPW